MPIAVLHIIEGRSDEMKECLIAEVSEAIARSLETPIESVRVLIKEVPKQHFGIAGVSARKLGR